MRNLVLLCLDSVRKDYFDRYAPRLRALSEVSLEGCRAASSWSIPSHASMLTGRLPHEHGVHTHNRDYATLSASETLFGDLPDHRRLGVSSNVFAGPAFDFDTLFDAFDAVSEARRYPAGLDPSDALTAGEGGAVGTQLALLARAARAEYPLSSLANVALTYADAATRRAPVPRLFDGGSKPLVTACQRRVEDTDEPFVLFVNAMEAHIPLEPTVGYDGSLYDAPPTFSTDDTGVWDLLASGDDHGEYLRRRRGLYAASIDYLDRVFAPFVESVLETTERETTVVVTADHGENLGYAADGGLVRHKSSLSEGLLHVPCEVVNPPAEPPDRRGLCSHLAFATLLPALARGEFPDVTREAVPAEVVGMSAGPEPPANRDHWDRMLRALIEGEHKHVTDSQGAVLRHALDMDRACWQGPPEAVDAVPDGWSSLFGEEIGQYKRRATADVSETDVSEAVARRLENLGYG
jgi:arylsulfatase A-like enzyme